MADLTFDRAFNRVFAGQNAEESKREAERRPPPPEDEEGKLRRTAAPMQVTDAIRRMLLADKDRDYFRLLELPAPEVDVLGRPQWDCSSADVSKAYRRLSVLVHPDKNPGVEARQAFEALNKAHRTLQDRGQLEGILKEHLDSARRRQEAAEAAATPDERVLLYAARKTQASALQKQERESYQKNILEQVRRKKEQAKRKRELQLRARHREPGSDAEEDEEDGEGTNTVTSSQPAAPSARLAKRGKPKLIF